MGWSPKALLSEMLETVLSSRDGFVPQETFLVVTRLCVCLQVSVLLVSSGLRKARDAVK